MSVRPTKCPIGNHILTGRKVYVDNLRLLAFIQMRLKDFTSDQAICTVCYRAVREVYRKKMEKALALKRKRRHANTVSSTSAADSSDSFETVINKSLSRAAAAARAGADGKNDKTSSTSTSNDTSTSSSDPVPPHRPTTRAKSNKPAPAKRRVPLSPLFEGPSTSKGAAEAQRRKLAAVVDADDDDDFVPSPNAQNGTRLPHVQPILKRVPFVHANPDVMKAYMEGITGG